MKLNFSSLAIIFFSLSAIASNKVGNGGDGVFCKDKAMLLDFYESDLKLDSKEKNPEIIAAQQLEKLKSIAPQLHKQYQKRLKEISSEIDFKNDISLTNIKDSKHLYQPLSKDCQMIQVAIRKAKIINNEKRFLIREDLWKKLPPSHQAGLLTHEIIYEHLAKLGEEDSIKARKINSLIFTTDMDSERFWKLLKDLEVPIYP